MLVKKNCAKTYPKKTTPRKRVTNGLPNHERDRIEKAKRPINRVRAPRCLVLEGHTKRRIVDFWAGSGTRSKNQELTKGRKGGISTRWKERSVEKMGERPGADRDRSPARKCASKRKLLRKKTTKHRDDIGAKIGQ